MMDTIKEQEVYSYLKDVDAANMDDVGTIQKRLMFLFDLPPNRALVLMDRWVQKLHKDKAASQNLRKHPWDQ